MSSRCSLAHWGRRNQSPALRHSKMTPHKRGVSARLLPSRLSLSVPELHRVGSPGPVAKGLADFTAGGDFHPAPKTAYGILHGITVYTYSVIGGEVPVK